MKRIKIDRKSIIFRVTSLIIILIVAQTILLSVFLILGGVLKQGETNAYKSFSDKVVNRKDYLEREMINRWINMDPYIDQISAALTEYGNRDRFFDVISDKLISIMRTAQTTGAFVILNSNESDKDYPSLYIRDYDPILNDYGNKDLYMIYGPSEIAYRLKIPLDQIWKYKISLDGVDPSFYQEPYQKASLTSQPKLLGYWSNPFKLSPDDISIITYTMPLFDKNNTVKGIIGIEVSTQYFSQFLPPTDLQARDSLGYFIGYRDAVSKGIKPILLTRSIQSQILNSDKKLSYRKAGQNENIFLLNRHSGSSDIYLCMEEMNLYSSNTPFENKQWYLIGMMSGDNLLSYVYKIQKILGISALSSILIAVSAGYFISYRFTKPVIRLAAKVRNSSKDTKIVLDPTGLTEVDELSHAIQITSNSLLDTAVKMSRIIDLVGVPIGAFEYSSDSESVFVTDQLQKILSIDPNEMKVLVNNKRLFVKKINTILRHPEEEEEDVYYFPDGLKQQWIKIKTVGTPENTIGVLTDITEEMLEKKRIKRDRDYDPLTGIYNRKAFQKKAEGILSSQEKYPAAALFMFDLDNLKTVNDTYGHKWGDLYIKLAVRHLKNISNTDMLLGRLSGDEFVLLLYHYPSKDAIRECIREFYRNLDKDLLLLPDDTKKAVTISAGLIWIDKTSLTYEEYLQYADEGLYKVKKSRKGTYFENSL